MGPREIIAPECQDLCARFHGDPSQKLRHLIIKYNKTLNILNKYYMIYYYNIVL